MYFNSSNDIMHLVVSAN